MKKNNSSLIRTSISNQICFEDYRLNIYNTINIFPSDKAIIDFIGLKVLDTYETKEEAALIFQNNYKVLVNLRDEAYSDPDAMYLTGPNTQNRYGSEARKTKVPLFA